MKNWCDTCSKAPRENCATWQILKMKEVNLCNDWVGASALDKQEGGDHYKKLKIQPMEYSMANKLDACQHTVIKYVTRFRDKNGVEDLRKAIHTLEMLIEFEERQSS